MKKIHSYVRSKKGFTLVELVVVLVILAILAALLIPSLTGYLNKTREEAAIVRCRQAVVAAKTTLAQKHSKHDTPEITRTDDGEAILALAGLEIPARSTVDDVFFGEFELDGSTLEHLYYHTGAYYVTYCAEAGGTCSQHGQTFTVASEPSIHSPVHVSTAALLSTIYSLPNTSNLRTVIYNSKSLTNPTSKVAQLWNSMSPDEQAFLADKTWRLDTNYQNFNSDGLFVEYKDALGNGWRLRVADKEYAPTESASNVSYSVYAYDAAGNVYRQNYIHGIVSNGELSSGSPVTTDSSGKFLPNRGWVKVN